MNNAAERHKLQNCKLYECLSSLNLIYKAGYFYHQAPEETEDLNAEGLFVSAVDYV